MPGITKAEDVKAPFGDGVNNSDVLAFTLGVASATGVLPVGWYGQFVRIRPVGGNMWFLITTLSTATAANPSAAVDGGPAITRAEYVANGEVFQCALPTADGGGLLYIARIGDTASTTVYVAKASGTPGNNTKNGV